VLDDRAPVGIPGDEYQHGDAVPASGTGQLGRSGARRSTAR